MATKKKAPAKKPNNADMKTLCITLILLLGFSAQVEAKKRLNHEKYYQAIHCELLEGEKEHRLPDKTRVDCLTDTMAIEHDFANKWAESVGQAVYYGKMTKRRPGIALIMEDPDKDAKFLKRLLSAVADIPGMVVWTISPDGPGKIKINKVFEQGVFKHPPVEEMIGAIEQLIRESVNAAQKTNRE